MKRWTCACLAALLAAELAAPAAASVNVSRAGEENPMVEVARSGVNFADTHAIRDDYLAKQSLPLTPGGEIAGLTPDGRRVAALLPTGGYAQRVALRRPDLANAVTALCRQYSYLRYAAPSVSVTAGQFQAAVRAFRPKATA